MGFHGADRKSGFLIWQELSFYSFTGNINRRLETHGSASLQKNHFSVLLGIGLCFRFHQTVFNVFFYFCWTGSLLTLFIFENPVAPPMETNPITFVEFTLKHSIPIIMTIYFIRNSEYRLSENAMMSSLKYMIGYAVFIAGYNMVFDENILDFRYSTLEIEKAFGPWPIYVIVNIALAILCYKIIDIITKKLVLIQN